MPQPILHACYGQMPADFFDVPRDATQTSPLVPESLMLGKLADLSVSEFTVLAPPGTLERRYVLAHALRALKPGGVLCVAAPKKKGGSRLKKELQALGCEVNEDGQKHYRICTTTRPQQITELAETLAQCGLQHVAELGLWSQPGVFSWDRIDAGSALLLEQLPPLSGIGADLGCGIGVLSKHVLAQGAVGTLHAIDLDGRAIEAAKRNLPDARVVFHWQDVMQFYESELDFVVMNPPFHELGIEDKGLGQRFILKAAEILKKGGVCWITANRHLPYEYVLDDAFETVRHFGEEHGYKIIEAIK